MPSGQSNSLLEVVLLSLGGILTAVLGFFAALFTQLAPRQSALNDAFTSLTDELQEERALLTARISELKEDVKVAEAEVIRVRGELRQSLQREESLHRLLERSGATLDLNHTAKIKPNSEDDSG